jgi:hypothetical protein
MTKDKIVQRSGSAEGQHVVVRDVLYTTVAAVCTVLGVMGCAMIHFGLPLALRFSSRFGPTLQVEGLIVLAPPADRPKGICGRFRFATRQADTRPVITW